MAYSEMPQTPTLFDWFLQPKIDDIAYQLTLSSVFLATTLYGIYILVNTKRTNRQNTYLLTAYSHPLIRKLMVFAIGFVMITLTPLTLHLVYLLFNWLSQWYTDGFNGLSVSDAIKQILQRDAILATAIRYNLMPEATKSMSQPQIDSATFLYQSFAIFFYTRLGITMLITFFSKLIIVLSPLSALGLVIPKRSKRIYVLAMPFFTLCMTSLLMVLIDLMAFSNHFISFISFIESQRADWKFTINQNLSLGLFFIVLLLAYLGCFWLATKFAKLIRAFIP